MIVRLEVGFNRPDVEGGIAALRAAGYEVLVQPQLSDENPIVVVDARRDIEIAPENLAAFEAEFDRDEIVVELDAEWDRVDAIIRPFYGEIHSHGPDRLS